MAVTSVIEVVPTGAALGAEVRGIDLSRPLSARDRRVILDAFHEHLVIYFRDQKLNDKQLVEFSSCFGEVMVDKRPVDYFRELDTDMPDVVDVVSNLTIDGKPIGALGSGEAVWHTDTLPIPNSALVLHALEVAESGGNTRFANCYAAYEALPIGIKAEIQSRILIHSRLGTLLNGRSPNFDLDCSRALGPWFPIVRTHGVTKRRSLFLGRCGEGHIVDLSPEESNALLRVLWDHMAQPQFVWEHRWKVGDVLVWDNRCTVHSRMSFEGRRRMHRTTVRGEWPQQ